MQECPPAEISGAGSISSSTSPPTTSCDASCSISVSSILGSCAAAWGSMRAKGDGVRLGVTPALAVACIAHVLVSHYVMSDRH